MLLPVGFNISAAVQPADARVNEHTRSLRDALPTSSESLCLTARTPHAQQASSKNASALLCAVLAATLKRRAGRFSSRPSYSSCAVVGSSGGLLGASSGKAVDEHEAVFRFNDAPVAPFVRWYTQKGLAPVLSTSGIGPCPVAAPTALAVLLAATWAIRALCG